MEAASPNSDAADEGSGPSLPPPPEKPDPRECCGRHCDPCIFDYYNRARAQWERRCAELAQRP